TPKFKANMTARYEYNLFDNESFVQGTVVRASEASIDLRAAEDAIIGKLPAYTLVDLSTGMKIDGLELVLYLSNAFDERALVGRSTQCAISVCGSLPYDTPMQPRTIGIKATHAF
ncbi:MAG: TonB-dependent receptor, partial [Alphaproteobacteria bacterium]